MFLFGPYVEVIVVTNTYRHGRYIAMFGTYASVINTVSTFPDKKKNPLLIASTFNELVI
jgi:hypothetical protein